MWRVWGRGEVCTGFWLANLKERDHWGEPDVDGRIILRWISQEVGGSCGDWMELAQYRDRWRALVGTVRNFLTTCRTSLLLKKDSAPRSK